MDSQTPDFYRYYCPLTISNIREILRFMNSNLTSSDEEIATIFSRDFSIPIHRLVIFYLRRNQHVYARLQSSIYENLRYYNSGYFYYLPTAEMTTSELSKFRQPL